MTTSKEGIRVPRPEGPPLDECSLVPLLEGEPEEWPDRLLFTRMPGWKTLVSYTAPMIENPEPFPGAVRTGRWRLVPSAWASLRQVVSPGICLPVAGNPRSGARRQHLTLRAVAKVGAGICEVESIRLRRAD